MMVTCKTPTTANAANCNVEKAKTIGGACAKQLHKDCAAKKLGFDRANPHKGSGPGRGGSDGPNKQPGSGSGRGACKTPTVANAANCNHPTPCPIADSISYVPCTLLCPAATESGDARTTRAKPGKWLVVQQDHTPC